MRDAWLRARSVYPYTGWVAEAVKRLKYGDEFDRSSQLGPLMAGLVAGFGRIDALVPVPLHSSRFDERG
jgi:predicted amidophosphoribosyltransferase